MFSKNVPEFQEGRDPLRRNSIICGSHAVDPDRSNTKRVTGMNVVGQVIADINAVERILAGTAASFQKYARMWLPEPRVFGEGHDREMVDNPGAAKLAQLLIADTVGNDAELLAG